MNSPTTELNTTQSKQEFTGTDDHSSKDSEEDTNVHTGLAGAPFWAGSPSDAILPVILPHPHQHTIQPGMVEPLSLRFHCPYPSTQCQVPYPDYLLEHQPSQYHLLTGPVPASSDSSHHGSFSAPWFTNEHVLCSFMPGDLHAPVAGTCVPPAVDHQQVQEGLTEVTSHITQSVVCNLSGGGHRHDGPARGTGVSVLGASSQLPQYHQIACSLYESRDQTASMQPQAPPARAAGTLCESKSRKPCHCTRSQCLKLYCECFANGVMCSYCDCSNCHNNSEHEVKRHKAIKLCLGRNPDAFRPKIAGGKSGEVKGWHNRGCNCKRSSCLKNYCECYEANIKCTSSCKCVGCRNYDNDSDMGMGLKEETVKDKWPASEITLPVVEAVCGCLLAQAEKAEREEQSPALAEHMVLDEFGRCLAQIVEAMFRDSTGTA